MRVIRHHLVPCINLGEIRYACARLAKLGTLIIGLTVRLHQESMWKCYLQHGSRASPVHLG